MGEYAKYKGERIKIGTCEDMFYLRSDQRTLVQPENGNVDPVKDAGEIRFRFPFPDEDKIPPGGFGEAFKSLALYGLDELLIDVKHSSRQFTAPGFCASLPCPESKEALDLPFKIHRNGYGGSVHIVQQRLIADELWTVCECGGCGAKFRLKFTDAEKLVVALRSKGDSCEMVEAGRNYYFHTIADRVLAGYKRTGYCAGCEKSYTPNEFSRGEYCPECQP